MNFLELPKFFPIKSHNTVNSFTENIFPFTLTKTPPSSVVTQNCTSDCLFYFYPCRWGLERRRSWVWKQTASDGGALILEIWEV